MNKICRAILAAGAISAFSTFSIGSIAYAGEYNTNDAIAAGTAPVPKYQVTCAFAEAECNVAIGLCGSGTAPCKKTFNVTCVIGDSYNGPFSSEFVDGGSRIRVWALSGKTRVLPWVKFDVPNLPLPTEVPAILKTTTLEVTGTCTVNKAY